MEDENMNKDKKSESRMLFLGIQDQSKQEEAEDDLVALQPSANKETSLQDEPTMTLEQAVDRRFERYKARMEMKKSKSLPLVTEDHKQIGRTEPKQDQDEFNMSMVLTTPHRCRTQEESSQESDQSRDATKNKTLAWKRFGLLLLFVLLFPALPLALAVMFGGLLALVEKATFLEGFLYVASNLSSLATPLTDFSPSNVGGVIIDVYISVVALMLFGIVLNVVNVFQIPLAMNTMIESFVKGSVIVPLIALGFLIPLQIAIVAVTFGALLALLEGWGVNDGIYYVFGNLLGLGTPLTSVTPQTKAGDMFDIYVSSLALVCLAIFVDYVTTLNPARHVRKRLKEALEKYGVVNLNDPGIPDRHPEYRHPIDDRPPAPDYVSDPDKSAESIDEETPRGE
jgi:hypothetical protein